MLSYNHELKSDIITNRFETKSSDCALSNNVVVATILTTTTTTTTTTTPVERTKSYKG